MNKRMLNRLAAPRRKKSRDVCSQSRTRTNRQTSVWENRLKLETSFDLGSTVIIARMADMDEKEPEAARTRNGETRNRQEADIPPGNILPMHVSIQRTQRAET